MKIKIDQQNRVVEAIADGYEIGDGWIDVEGDIPMDFYMCPMSYSLVDEKLIKTSSMESVLDEERRIIERTEPILLQTRYITREDFNLIDAQDDHTLYYILEEDGTTTMVKGENR